MLIFAVKHSDPDMELENVEYQITPFFNKFKNRKIKLHQRQQIEI